jgi:hypothetical protein
MSEQSAPPPEIVINAEMRELLRCKRCNLPYASSRSTSALRLTYCSLFCELSDLGFSMDALEHMQRNVTPDDAPIAEPVAVE